MKVSDAPLSLLIDSAQCELTIVAGGVRIVMSAGEAAALWSDLGESLRGIFARHPQRCPPNLGVLLAPDRAFSGEDRARHNRLDDKLLESLVAYAQRASPLPGPAGHASAQADPPEQPDPKPAGSFARAIGKLTGR
ncbi:MAG TPA: hypothetical protein VN668_06280 [Stellaceae bacterium]|nr:hypothetical protein [Stellaceae bacterium]